MKISMPGQKESDLLIQVTAWVGLTVFGEMSSTSLRRPLSPKFIPLIWSHFSYTDNIKTTKSNQPSNKAMLSLQKCWSLLRGITVFNLWKKNSVISIY